jgi:hypothetical protein
MNPKSSAVLALLLAIAPASAAVAAQAAGNPAGAGQNAPAATASRSSTLSRPSRPAAPGSAAQQNPTVPAAESNSGSDAPEMEPSHITIATPAPAPSPWPWQERIAWGANLMLVVLGYVGIMLALSALKKIERQTEYAESTAQAAADGAHAALVHARSALLHAQAMARAERPWILVTVEPSQKAENRFMVMATNRGKGPARIISAVDKITTEADQTALPEEPYYDDAAPNASLASIILLPGESTGIKSFSRDDVREFCGSEENFRRVERWEELILLYGKIIYEDLVATDDEQFYESSWCCWYIHGRQNSGMVTAGSPAYNRHT